MSDQLRPPESAHPDEALAGLVDGTLTAAERADLQAHLDGCDRCRSEVALAESAARALRALPELDAPWNLGREAIEEARKGARPGPSRRWATVAGVAAAAVLVVGLSVAVLRGPQDQHSADRGPNATSQPNDSNAGAAFASSGPVIVKSTQNFDPRSVADLASKYSVKAARNPQRKATAPPEAPFASIAATSGSVAGSGNPSAAPVPSVAPTGESGTNPAPGGTSGTRPESDRAKAIGPVACVDAAAGYGTSTMPVRVIDARFEEKPALIGIFLQGPGADQPADVVVIWVASHDCQVLSFAQHRIAP